MKLKVLKGTKIEIIDIKNQVIEPGCMGSILAVINVPMMIGKVDSELGFYPNDSESPCKRRLHL